MSSAHTRVTSLGSTTSIGNARVTTMGVGVETAPDPGRSDREQRRLDVVTVVLGCWQLVLAAVVTVAAFAAWSVLAGATGTAAARVHWWGPDFTLSITSGALLLGLVGGIAGSLVHTITIFSSRVGRDTLEASFLWWYLLRPFAAALLALLFVAALLSGVMAVGGAPKDPQPAVALVAGGLAGLFTDAVLQKLRGLLGATSTEQPATSQTVPLADPPAPSSEAAGQR